MTNGSEPLTAQLPAPAAPRIWGYFATFGWALLAYVVASLLAILVMLMLDPTTLLSGRDFSAIMKDARSISVSTIATDVIMVAVLVLAIWVARSKATDYLALTWPPGQEVRVALLSLVLLLPALDGLAYLVGQPIIAPFVIDVYKSAQSQGTMVLLWLAIVIAAPIAEEIIFRGFLFRGWVRPTRWPMLGILVITLLFTIIHLQYNWFGMLQVFMLGLLLTWTRWRSGSTLLPMAMHVIANFYAMLQAVAYFRWFV